MPTIFDPEDSHLSAESKYLKLPIPVPRKSPTKRCNDVTNSWLDDKLPLAGF